MLKVTKNYRNQYLIQTETSTITSNSESQDPCLNFCFNGDCKLTSLNIPHCHCQNNFTGKRCEVNVCYNYCLNNGVCRVPTTQGDLQRNVSFSKCQKLVTLPFLNRQPLIISENLCSTSLFVGMLFISTSVFNKFQFLNKL